MNEGDAQTRVSELLLLKPATPNDWELYYDLRWLVLREPWQQPRGSERDDRDDTAIHLMLRAPDGEVVAAGRLHFNSASEAQVRFMAVAEGWRGSGAGSRVLRALEKRARNDGAQEIILNSRDQAIPFYEKHGYQVVGSASKLFNQVAHVRMRKSLTSQQ
jgi:predicted GNAT family N-acyltransferase